MGMSSISGMDFSGDRFLLASSFVVDFSVASATNSVPLLRSDAERTKRDRTWMGMLKSPLRKKMYFKNSRPPLITGAEAILANDSFRGTSQATGMAW